MEDLDPIRQLQILIDDRDKVLERISSIYSALGSIKSTGSNLAERQLTANQNLAAETKVAPITEERPYDRLLNTLQDMQAQIEQRLRPLAAETLRGEEALLREQWKQEHEALENCLVRMDQCIMNCRDRIDEYEKGRAELERLNQRLATLGAAPEPLPESSPARDIVRFINTRLESLQLARKAQ